MFKISYFKIYVNTQLSFQTLKERMNVLCDSTQHKTTFADFPDFSEKLEKHTHFVTYT